MRIADIVKECVLFVGTGEPINETEQVVTLRGTAFFIGVPSEEHDDRFYTYIVTAKHVFDMLPLEHAFLRANLKNGGAKVLPLDKSHWHFHPSDVTADVAMVQVGVGEDLDYKYIAPDLIIGSDALAENADISGIGIGDEVYTVGLFAHHFGAGRNIPIVRVGHIAMMDEDLVPVRDGDKTKMVEAILIEARSIGGLSGSPVFVRSSNAMSTSGAFLLGMALGHWEVQTYTIDEAVAQEIEPTDASGKLTSSMNSGVALVTPAKKIIETLMQPLLREARKKADLVAAESPAA